MSITTVSSHSRYTTKLTLLVTIACSLGLFLDGYLLYISSVAEPFIQQEFHPSSLMSGLLQAAAPLGAGFGAIIFGRVCDKVGRKTMLLFNLLFFVVIALLSAFSWNTMSLGIFRFLIGVGIGMDYPIVAAYLSEMTPENKSNRSLAVAMAVNCLASPIGVLVAWLIFTIDPSVHAWRFMFASSIVPAIAAIALRLNIPESFLWKAHQKLIANKKSHGKKVSKQYYLKLFSAKYLKITLVLCFAWFLMDIALYGIVLFTPMILSSLHLNSGGNFTSNTTEVIKSTLYVNSFIVFGAVSSIFIISKVKSVSLQKFGFILSFIGLLVISMSVSQSREFNLTLIYTGFIMFNFFINLGPGITTYLLPAKIYPTKIRATGHGVATGVAKLGAFAGVIMLPLLTKAVGIHITVFILSFACLGGYLITRLIPINMEEEISESNSIDPRLIEGELGSQY